MSRPLFVEHILVSVMCRFVSINHVHMMVLRDYPTGRQQNCSLSGWSLFTCTRW